MIMNEHQKETTFLSHIIRYDDSDEGRKLQQSIRRFNVTSAVCNAWHR